MRDGAEKNGVALGASAGERDAGCGDVANRAPLVGMNEGRRRRSGAGGRCASDCAHEQMIARRANDWAPSK